VHPVQLLRCANANELMREREFAERPSAVCTSAKRWVKTIRSPDQECGVPQAAIHQSLKVFGQFNGPHLRSVFVQENEVIDALEVFVHCCSFLFHYPRRVGLGVLPFEVGGFEVLIFGIPRESFVVHVYTFSYPRL